VDNVTTPQIQYARTRDDISIAYWKIGAGPPLVQLPFIPFSHIEMEWQLPALRDWYERLGRGATLIRYDGRGNGLSQRGVADHSVDAHVRDLEAVVEQLGGNKVALLGIMHSGPAAIAYAARSPERVSHLLLWCTYAHGPDYWNAAQAEGLRVLRQTDYRLFLRTASHELLGWVEDEQIDGFAEVMRESVDPEEADQLIADTRTVDVRPALSQVACPTLVMHRRQMRWLDQSLSRGLASRLRDARLAVVEGSSPLPAVGDIEAPAALVDEFLGHEVSVRPREAAGSLRAVVFTDLVGHTEMMSRLGDEKGREVLRAHERITRAALADFGGKEVKTMGDGFMASFGSVTQAVQCAIGLQREIGDRSSETGDRIAVRIGLNAGEPIEESGSDGRADLFGATVILAARIAQAAQGGEILVSDTVRGLCSGKGFSFKDRGEFEAKGFGEPIRLFEVRWQD
jgi:class 3 adenylate cyclase